MTTHSADKHTLAAGDGVLSYRLQRTGRRRTVAVYVEPDQSITVLAPADATLERVETILARKFRWIRSQQTFVASLPPPPPARQWTSGETHRYLGRQYRLRVAEGDANGVRLVGGYFLVTRKLRGNRIVVEKLMRDWYAERAATVLSSRVSKILAETTWLSLKVTSIRVRPLKKRWGSASLSGRITFNTDLVKLPIGCIDYVVCHELVHLQVPNHSSEFWQLLGRVMPDWKRWRDRLANIEY